MSGGKHDDVMLGDDGNDVLSGNVGNDEVQGGPGDDRMFSSFQRPTDDVAENRTTGTTITTAGPEVTSSHISRPMAPFRSTSRPAPEGAMEQTSS